MAGKKEIEEIFSKSVRSGRRTYFFDVRSTRAEDYFLTITESKRDFNEDGSPFYKKHTKLFLPSPFNSYKKRKIIGLFFRSFSVPGRDPAFPFWSRIN